MLALLEDAEEQQLENDYSRICPDPSISVADLENCLQQYMVTMGYRNIQEVVDAIVGCKCTWKTSPKAVAWQGFGLI